MRDCIRLGDYQQAYLLGRDALSGNERGDSSVMSVLCELTARLRAECMSMAVRQADHGREYLALEGLLRQVNNLTDQDMYGNFR